MTTFETIYIGELRTSAKHLASGETIIADAPIDNMGKGEAFSPTDLMSASIVSCMLTIMGISAVKNNFSIDGTKVKGTKVMTSEPRRISEVIIEMILPNFVYTQDQKKMIFNAAMNCPVAKSIHPDLKLSVTFHFNDETVLKTN